MDEVKTRRPYRSPLRAEAARRTRAAIVSAAAELFAERGYAGTSLAEVAETAGVARPTVVSAFGSKPALLKVVVDQALAGDDDPVPVAQRTWFQPVWNAASPEGVLDAYAGVCTLIGARAATVFEVVRRAADDAPEAADLWHTLLDNRWAGAAMVVDRARDVGALRRGLTRQQAVDGLWLLNDPAHHAALVAGRGWSERTFRTWLARQMSAALLP